MDLPIITERLLIAEFDESMAESVHINSLDEDNRRFLPDEVFESAQEAWETMSVLITYYSQNDKPLVYPLILHEGQQIGHVQAIPVDDGWEIGYHIGKPYTGNGYATEAVKGFLPKVMEWLGIGKMYAVCHAGNIASRKVLEKCNFSMIYEGMGLLHGKRQPMCRFVYSSA